MYIDECKTIRDGKIYTRVLIRESYRENGKVKHKTIANISDCSSEEIQAIKIALKHKGDLSELSTGSVEVFLKQGLSVGAVFVLSTLSKELGLSKALGISMEAKFSLWMVLSRLIEPGSRLANVRLAQQHAAVDVLGLDDFNEDDLYDALDWVHVHQEDIESRLFRYRYSSAKPELFLYDVSSSYLEGDRNELGEYGYNRDGKKGKKQIVYGLLTDENGWPVSVECFKGNTQDPMTFKNQVDKVKQRFGCERITMVGDRGMIKSCQIALLPGDGLYYITAITKPQIESLLKQNIIQMELFCEELCEVEYDNTRYILKRNPVRAEELKDNRKNKIEKIQELIKEKNHYLTEHKRAVVTVAVRTVKEHIAILKLSDFLSIHTEKRTLSLICDDTLLEEITKLDGCYVIKSNVPKDTVRKEIIHERYKDLAYVENAFRTMKTDQLEIRPVNVRKEKRTRAHVFIVMLAYTLSKHLREKWMDLDITVEEGIQELSTICTIETHVGSTIYNQIPEPRNLGVQLLKRLHITLPPVIQHRGIHVATRKKLNLKRKKIKKSS